MLHTSVYVLPESLFHETESWGLIWGRKDRYMYETHSRQLDTRVTGVKMGEICDYYVPVKGVSEKMRVTDGQG